MIYDKFQGVFTALVTPFDVESGKISFSDLANLINSQIDSGIQGLLLLGSTSEASTLSEDEKVELLESSLQIIEKRVPVMIGLNYNDTAYAVKMAKKFCSIVKKFNFSPLEAALLVNPPSYNKPKEEGVFAHFDEIHDACDLPIFVYNIPSRSIFDLKNHLLMRLFELERIIGLKDCSGDLMRVFELKKNEECFEKKKLYFFAGDDNTSLFHFINGGCGVISVTSNAFPKEMSEMFRFLKEREYTKAAEIHLKLMPFFQAFFIEPNPSPIKYALSLKAGIQNVLRLPLLPVSGESSVIIKKLMNDCEFS